VQLAVIAAVLTLVLNPPPRAVKLTRLVALEQARSSGEGELERLLRDSDPGIRRRAVLAAGRIGDASLCAPVAGLLTDPRSEVRQMAALALGLIRDRSVVDPLRTALSDPDPAVRGRVAEALGRIGDKAAADDVAQMVIAALPRGARLVTVRGDDPNNPADPWIELRLGLFSLAALGDARAAERVLLLEGEARFDWWAAAYAASRIRSNRLLPVHLSSARSSDPLCRSLGAAGLGMVGAPEAVSPLSALVGDPDETVVVQALRALGQIGDVRATPAAVSALTSPSINIKQAALAALGHLPLDRMQRDQVVPYVGHSDPTLRGAALAVLARSDPEQLALVLSGIDPDPVWFVRATLARALGDSEGDFALGLVFSALRDPDPRVLPAAIGALQRLKGADAVETLRKYLQHGDAAIRVAAADALVALRVPGLAGAVGEAYRSVADTDCASRLALVLALAADPSGASTAVLQTAADKDACASVSERAVQALAARGVDVARRAAASAGPYVDDRIAIAPFEPVPGLPLFTPRVFVHTPRGVIELHLNIVEAPGACASFSGLARRGFYDGLVFDDVVPGVAVWGGSPRGDVLSGPGFGFRSEPGERPFGRGAVGLVRPLDARDSEGSRFLITLQPAPALDGGTTLLGWVVSGLDVVARLRPGDAIDRVEVWDGR
jgi:peptidyl-prolyl cis-trans isomerase B (cyclophilin B)